jgi:hypothetical protein
MIAVNRMNASLAKSMAVKLREDGQLAPVDGNFSSNGSSSSLNLSRRREEGTPGGGRGGGAAVLSPTNGHLLGRGMNKALPIDGVPFQRRQSAAAASPAPVAAASSRREEDDIGDIYVRPPRRKSICKQLMEYLFSYKY